MRVLLKKSERVDKKNSKTKLYVLSSSTALIGIAVLYFYHKKKGLSRSKMENEKKENTKSEGREKTEEKQVSKIIF